MNLAYLITFRTYGSWLPGDERGFVDHARQDRAATQRSAHSGLHRVMQTLQKHQSPVLDETKRRIVENAIRAICETRNWTLHAISVRSNHVHVVVSANTSGERTMLAFKSYATFQLRTQKLWDEATTLWARHGSTRPLRDENSLQAACRYVVERQGDEIPV